MQKITAREAYFIKLGDGGRWESDCIAGGFARVSYDNVHVLCVAGDWAKVTAFYVAQGRTPGTSKRWANELRRFYEAGPETLWVTFNAGLMYWGFMDGPVIPGKGTEKERKISGGWKSNDVSGVALSIRRLSSKLTKVRGYRGTICGVEQREYLVKKVNAEELPNVARARQRRTDLLESISQLIETLSPWDFEVLIDMVFTAGGWRRVGIVGGNEADTDVDLIQPVTGERIVVQVKSRTDAAVVADIAQIANARTSGERFYLITHSHRGGVVPATIGRLEFFDSGRISALVLDAGLCDWVIEKAC